MFTLTVFTGSWIKTKGGCRYSDGSFDDAFTSTEVTSHGECKDFCIKNSKCDAFDTDGTECFLFNDKDGKKHIGNGEGEDFCYVRDLGASPVPARVTATHMQTHSPNREATTAQPKPKPQSKPDVCPMEGGYCVKVTFPTPTYRLRALTLRLHSLSSVVGTTRTTA